MIVFVTLTVLGCLACVALLIMSMRLRGPDAPSRFAGGVVLRQWLDSMSRPIRRVTVVCKAAPHSQVERILWNRRVEVVVWTLDCCLTREGRRR